MVNWSKTVAWLRTHLVATVLGSLVAGFGSAWGIASTLEQTRLDRFEDRMLADYQSVAASDQALAISLEKLSFDLSRTEGVDANLIREMNSQLVRMYVTLNSFKIGLDDQSLQKISAYQSALTDFKAELLKTAKSDDLQFLASRYADVLRAFDEAKPVIEERIGTSILKNS